ncbi:MAG: aldolase [Patescibacteria group bacterium]|jgi:fructose-bisphosphate aldolase/6-deoxy-5-ketofructose 1-phosphate synthase|nr:aldolase [bacterium]HQC50123.1 aldolase [bacterium]
MKNFNIPLSVPKDKRLEYEKNYKLLTASSGNLFLIAGDQKIEHLNDDFFGPGISLEDSNPEHLFRIASASEGGVLATHLGLIARYGQSYWNVPYVVKLNGKTNLGPNEEKDSSKNFWKVKHVVNFKKNSGLKIVGVGYTLYLGGKNEGQMLARAAKTINDAHEAGLIAILWVYPRGKNIKEEDIHTIAGGAGVAASLNADFAKVKYPYGAKDKKIAAKKFQEVIDAAGKTKIICVGGKKQKPQDLLEFTSLQLTNGSVGLAIGRNLHQRSLKEATKLARALSALILKGVDLKEAIKIYNKKEAPVQEVKKNTKFLGLF